MKINHWIKEKFGWGIYHQDLLRPSFKFIKARYPQNQQLEGCEIGTHKGINALQILKHLNIKKLVLIDSWENYGDYKEYGSENLSLLMLKSKKLLKNYLDRIEFKKAYSHHVANIFPSEQFDFIYIDSNHKYKYVKQDIEDYYPKIKKGGVLCGHDINFTGVFRAVLEFITKNKIKVFTGGQDWWVIKK